MLPRRAAHDDFIIASQAPDVVVRSYKTRNTGLKHAVQFAAAEI
ncbi:MAG: hypothetical protein U0768_01135 [Anaerolineae bacterium]